MGTPTAVFAARANFELIGLDALGLRDAEFFGTGEELRGQFQEQHSQLQNLERRYTSLLRYRLLDFTFAAYFSIGELYEEFAHKLRQAPLPSDLPGTEAEAYASYSEFVADRFEWAAIEWYELTLSTGDSFKIENRWTRDARSRMDAVRKPDTSPPSSDIRPNDGPA